MILLYKHVSWGDKMRSEFSVQDLAELTRASRELYYQGVMPIDEVRFFRKLLNKKSQI